MLERPARKRSRWRRFILLTLLAVVAAGTAWLYKMNLALGGGKSSLISTFSGIVRPLEQFPSNHHPIILVVGRDYNTPANARSKRSSKNSRADTIMLISADLEGKKLSAVSIPRDTLVSAPDGVTGNINATLARGGVDLLMETIASQFGVRPDYYVLLKADAVKNMVDAVGGVEVTPIDRMFYEDYWGNLSIDLQPGTQRINGNQAIGFVRFRKSGDHRVGPKGESIPVPFEHSKEEGDIRRTERQQMLIRSLASEALRPNNWGNAANLVETAFQQVDTNLERTQLLALATIFRNSTSGLAGGTIPGDDSSIGGKYAWKPDLERSQLMISWLLRNDEMAGRQLTRVDVYNASEERGANSVAAEKLCSLGFRASATGRSEEKEAVVVYRKAAYETYARLIAETLGIAKVEKDFSNGNEYWLSEIKVILTQPLPGETP